MSATLVDHLWQSTVFAVLCGLLTIPFRRHAAEVRYWIWFAASVKFLVPFPALMALGRSLDWRADPETWAWAEGVAQPMTTLTVAGEGGMPYGPALLGVWLLGSVVVFGIWVVRWCRLQAALRDSVPARLPQLVSCDIAVRTTPGMGPGIVGFVHPVLVLPKGIAERLAPQHLKPVLLHEIGHLRRQDNMTALVHMIVETVFWFHPLVWWIGGRLITERERACDEFVVASGGDPHAYAEGVLEVCRFHVESPLPCAAGISRAALKGRIETIAENRRPRRLGRQGLAVLVGAGASAWVVPILLGTAGVAPVIAKSEWEPAVLTVSGAARGASAWTPDFSLVAVERVTPSYPEDALASGQEGWVVVEYTVTEHGAVDGAVVIESNPRAVFDRAALAAVERWRYRPLTIANVPVRRAGVRTRIAFEVARSTTTTGETAPDPRRTF